MQTTTIMAPVVHPDLQQERDRATFDLDQLTYIFDGSRETTEKRRSLGTYDEYVGSCHNVLATTRVRRSPAATHTWHLSVTPHGHCQCQCY